MRAIVPKFFILTLSLVIVAVSLTTRAAESIVQGENLLSPTHAIETVSGKEKKGLVIIFMSAVCPCSNSHVAIVKKLSSEYKDFSFVVVHSNLDEDSQAVRDYFKKADFSFPVIEDKNYKIADLYKANKTPHAFILNAAGEIVYRGGVTNSAQATSADKNYLADALKDLTENKEIRVSSTRTLGCAIVRKGEKNVL